MFRLYRTESSLFLLRRFVMDRRVLKVVSLVVFAGVLAVAAGKAQTPTPSAQPDQASPDAGGPSGDPGVIAVPKKKESKDDAAPLPPAPAERTVKNPVDMPSTSIRIEVPEVSVDVGVLLEKTHQFVPGLKPSNFRVYEDGLEQKIEGFNASIPAKYELKYQPTNSRQNGSQEDLSGTGGQQWPRVAHAGRAT